MNPIAIRELARFQSVLKVLLAERDALSELSDIQALRELEEDYREILEGAQKRGLVPKDPVAAVKEDFSRLAAWSNRIQLALRAADDLGRQKSLGSKPDQDSGKKRVKVDTGWAPTLSELQRVRTLLEGAPRALAEAMEQGRAELQSVDWSSGRPYPELVEIADALGWTEKLELAESPGPWTQGIPLKELPFVASRLAIESGSPMIERRQRSLKDRLAHVVELIKLHTQHATKLDDVGKLVGAGQVKSARQLMANLQPFFTDLNYCAKEEALSGLEKQMEAHGKQVAAASTGLQAIGRQSSGFFFSPPLNLMRRAGNTVDQAEKLIEDIFVDYRRYPSGSELERTLEGWKQSLKGEVDVFKTGPMKWIRRWIVGTSLMWLVVLTTGGLMLQHLVRQVSARQRLVAESSAGDERAKAKAETEERKRQRLDAEAKAETEERKRQRLDAEAKVAEERVISEARARVEAADAEMASKLGMSRPFESGARGQAGVVAVRWIPAGRYTMGSPNLEEFRDSDEVQHEVEIGRGFLMAETECTQGQWEAVMGDNSSYFKDSDRPVERVSWDQAVEYCRKLTVKQRASGIIPEGWEWRLPTEAEWEYAARAETTGARHGELDAIAWYDVNSGSQTHPVKQKAANAWGLHDMMGNVWEWCLDWHGDYPNGSVTDPTGPMSGAERVFRGGCVFSGVWFARSAERHTDVSESRNEGLGFRPVLSSVR